MRFPSTSIVGESVYENLGQRLTWSFVVVVVVALVSDFITE